MDYGEILDLLRQTTEPSAGDYMLAVMMFVLWAEVVLVLLLLIVCIGGRSGNATSYCMEIPGNKKNANS